MLNKITKQFWQKCINEMKKEENLNHVEKEIIIPIMKRYNKKMIKWLVIFCIMYSIIILLLFIILIIIIKKKSLVN